MIFEGRIDAGKRLAEVLYEKFKYENVIVYAIPRGGVVVAKQISKKLNSPIDLIITRKIGHPDNPEYALGAVCENGEFVGNNEELKLIDKKWLQNEIEKEKIEARRRRGLYLSNQKPIDPKGKTAILVDDGIATGFTITAAIAELKSLKPKKIIVAVPICPFDSSEIIKKEVDEVIALQIVPSGEFLGAVGSYYKEFDQVNDKEVKSLL